MIRSIQRAPIFKRIVAAFLDAIVTGFLYFLLTTYVCTPIARKGSDYDQKVTDTMQYEVASHLFMFMQQNDIGKYIPIEVKNFTEELNNQNLQKISETRQVEDFTLDDQIKHLQYYYTVYLSGDISRVELPNPTPERSFDPIKDKFISPYYNVLIEGKMPLEFYSTHYFNVTIMGLPKEGEANQSPYYDYPVVDGKKDYDGIPVLKEGADGTKALADIKDKMYSATKSFYYSEYMTSMRNRINSIQLWCYVPTYVVLLTLFYFVIPIVTKNGQTLGKITMNIAVINKNGYAIKKRQTVYRFLVFAVEISLSLFILGTFNLTSLATLGVGIVILLVATLISKEYRSPHDYAAMTMCVDNKTSVFFDNATEEENAENRLDENLAKLHEYEPEKTNIIQVGGTIIDPSIKEEIEKNKKNKKTRK